MRRGVIEIIVKLLTVFPVIAFVVGETKHAFLQDRIIVVPQCKCKAEMLIVIRDAGYAILAPAVGAGARLIMREIIPRIAIITIIFPDGSPLSFTEVGSPNRDGHRAGSVFI